MRFLSAIMVVFLLFTGCSVQKTEKVSSSEKPNQNNVQKQESSILGEFKGTVNTVGNTNGNLNGQGIVAQEGNRIYFSEGKKLYAANSSDLDKRLLLDQAESDYSIIDNLNIVNNVLYYVKNSDIWSIQANGKEKKQITKDAGVQRMMVWQDKIVYIGFFSNDKQKFKCNRLYIMNLDGTGKRLLSGEANNVCLFNIENNQLFYTVDATDEPVQKLVCYDLDPKDTASYDKDDMAGTVKMKMNQIVSILVMKDKIYYSTPNIELSNLDGENPNSIRQANAGYLNIAGNDLFFVDAADNSNPIITRISKEGGVNCQVFPDTTGAYIYGITDSKLFTLLQNGKDYTLKIQKVEPVDYSTLGSD